MIKVESGSIFDSKCDLIVIPCDSAGGVTSSVHKDLKIRNLPTQIGSIPFGMVYFRDVRSLVSG